MLFKIFSDFDIPFKGHCIRYGSACNSTQLRKINGEKIEIKLFLIRSRQSTTISGISVTSYFVLLLKRQFKVTMEGRSAFGFCLYICLFVFSAVNNAKKLG